jgi:hypothetical protein
MTTDLREDIDTIIEELKLKTNVIKTIINLAENAISDAEENMSEISSSMDVDKVNDSIDYLVEAQAFIDSIGLRTPKFTSLIDDLDSIRFQIKYCN